VSRGAFLTAVNLGQFGARLELDGQATEIRLTDDDGVLSVATPESTTVAIGDDDQGPISAIEFRRISLDQNGSITSAVFAVLSRAGVADVLLVAVDPEAAVIAPVSLPASTEYTVSDALEGFDFALEIPPDNLPPVVADDSAAVDEGNTIAINVLANDSDPDGDTLTLVAVSGATLGSATISNNRIIYRPNPDADGEDILTYTVSDGTVEVTGTVTVTVTANETIDGTGGSDLLVGTDGPDTINGGNGNDTINAGDGDDVIIAGIGFDVVNGEGGDDFVRGLNGFDTLSGGAGNDTLQGNAGRDLLLGGDGDDLLLGGVQADSLEGGAGNDSLVGASGADTLDGGAGDDTLQGNSGFDVLRGGDGADVLDGGVANDSLEGGAGNDSLVGANGADTLDGGTGDDTLEGNSGFDLLRGGDGADLLDGGLANDTLEGGAGDDTLEGANGSDLLLGGDGADRLEGNAGADTLDGGAGDDVLRGGLGPDTFVFRAGYGNDRIADLGNVDTVQIEAGLVGPDPVPDDLRALSSLNADGFLVLDFGGGDTLTFTGITNTGAILDDVSFI
jgi:Ca2+-binding RTX toxin-like protein